MGFLCVLLRFVLKPADVGYEDFMSEAFLAL